MTENEIAKIVVDAAIEVHRELGGPGLLEDIYEEALAEELRLRGLLVERQLPVRITYKGRVLSKPLRLDMRVEKLVLVDTEEQTRILEQMRQQAIEGSPSGAAESLAYVVNYYSSGSKQREGSRLDSVVKRIRSCAVRDIVSHVRQKTGEDLGEKPEAWIEKYAKKK